MKKLRISATAVLLAAVLLLGGCSKPKGDDDTSSGNGGYLTLRQKAYLNDMKKRLGASVDVAFARDRLDLNEITLPGEYDGYAVDYSRCLLIDENRVFAELVKNGRVAGFAVYNIADGAFERVPDIPRGGAAGENNAVKALYADSEFAVILDYYELPIVPTDPGYGESGERSETDCLYIYYIATGKLGRMYQCEDNRFTLAHCGHFAALNGDIYFELHMKNETENRLDPWLGYYNTDTNRSYRHIGGGYAPELYNGGIVYQTGFNENTQYKIKDGGELLNYTAEYPDWTYTPVFAGDKIFELRSGAVKWGEESGAVETFSNRATGEVIFSKNYVYSEMNYNERFVSFAGVVGNSGGSEEKFIYGIRSNELLVFDEGEETLLPIWSKSGHGLCLGESSGSTIKAYVVSDKNGYSDEEPAPPDGVTYLDRRHKYISYVPVISWADAYDIRTIDDIGIPSVINGHNAMREMFIELNGSVSVLMCLYDPDRTGMISAIEYGLYDLETRTYSTLIKAEDYGGRLDSAAYSEGYLFFSTADDYAFVGVELDPGIANPTVIRIGEGLDYGRGCVVGEDGLFYFSACVKGTYSRGLYSFDPNSGETKKLADEGYSPFKCGEEVFYYSYDDNGRQIIRSLGGRYSFNASELAAASPLGIFVKRQKTIDGKGYEVVANLITGDEIFAAAMPNGVRAGHERGGYCMNLSGSDEDSGGIDLTYDIRGNRLIVYDETYTYSYFPEWNSYDCGSVRNFDNGQYYVFTLK